MPAQPCTLKKAVHLQATVCAKFGLPCIIYMGAKDMERQALNVFRMRLLGAEVSPGFNPRTAPVVAREGCSDVYAHCAALCLSSSLVVPVLAIGRPLGHPKSPASPRSPGRFAHRAASP